MIVPTQALLAAADSLVVIAPHPDDDVLGCGALLATAAERVPIAVVYVTDGAASHRCSLTYPPERLRRLREREAARGLLRLGVTTPPRFLRCTDGDVPGAGDLRAGVVVRALRDAIVPGRTLVAAPWRRDHHADHRSVAALVEAALRARPDATRIEYAVWLGVLGEASDAPAAHEGRELACDARPYLRVKRAALREHRSQFGRVITDAAWSFALPSALIESALGPRERFVVPHGMVLA